MIIKTLCENTSVNEDIKAEHGLSFYLELNNGRKLMIDTGQTDLFYENAEKMEVDVSDVECLVISHGHYDHVGGLNKFLEVNKKAKIYVHELGFDDYFSKSSGEIKYIGMDKNLEENPQIVKTKGIFEVDEDIKLFSDVAHETPLPASNSGLFMKENGEIVQDKFLHEQNTIIKEDGKYVLFTGCSHNGIVNILKQFYKNEGRYPDFVIGGFHFSWKNADADADFSYVDEVGKFLLETGAKFYTGHCTGIPAYERLKEIMGDKIDYLASGSVETL